MARKPKIDEKRPLKGKSLLTFPDRYVMLDIETTGLDSGLNEIIEISAARVEHGRVLERYDTLVHPVLPIGPETTELTGITNAMVRTAPRLADVLPGFLRFVEGEILAGHNVNFDICFLYDALMRLYGLPLTNDYVDTLRISRKLYPEEKCHKLADLKERFFLESEHDHRAYSDVDLTIKCLEHMRSVAEDRGLEMEPLA